MQTAVAAAARACCTHVGLVLTAALVSGMFKAVLVVVVAVAGVIHATVTTTQTAVRGHVATMHVAETVAGPDNTLLMTVVAHCQI
jgi:hypothetical protein